MNIAINNLLDEESLSPQQEREIRRLFNYKIEKTTVIDHGPNGVWKTQYVLYYSRPMETALIYTLKDDALDQLKARSYQTALMFWIQVKAIKMTTPLLIPRINNILNNGALLNAKDFPKTNLHFGTGWVIEIPHADNIKPSSLYQAFKLIKDNEKCL